MSDLDLNAEEQADAFDAMSEQAAVDENDPAELAERAEVERLAELEYGEPGFAPPLDAPEETPGDKHDRAHIYSRVDAEADAESVQEQREADEIAAVPSVDIVEERRRARVLAEEIVAVQREPIKDPAEVATERATAEVRKLLHAQDDARLERDMETEIAADELTLERIEEKEELENERLRREHIAAGYPEKVPEQTYGAGDGIGEDHNPLAVEYEGFVDVAGRARLIQRETDRNAMQAAANFMRERSLDD